MVCVSGTFASWERTTPSTRSSTSWRLSACSPTIRLPSTTDFWVSHRERFIPETEHLSTTSDVCSTRWKCGNCCGVRQCHRGRESQQKCLAQWRHTQLWLGLWLHLPPTGIRSNRHPAGSALLHQLAPVCPTRLNRHDVVLFCERLKLLWRGSVWFDPSGHR